ncbi:MAG TPA: arylesterase [Vicinamibacterales bacterium]|nr:arylesterase [Vicinamibacterales bacterium]
MRAWVIGLLSTALACTACGSRDETPAAAPPSSAVTAAAPAAPSSEKPRIVFLGDSLTAGLGLSADEAYPSLLQQRLNEQGLPYDVVNAGVSGDTSAGGLSRLEWALSGDVRVLIVALGGNDGLRGLPPEQLKRNLTEIILRAQARHITVVLAGMEAPPNYGRDYAIAFHRIYPSLAKEYHVALVPFLLQGVGGVDRLNQRDGIHPTAEGARIVADNVWTVLAPIVQRHAS